MSICFTWVLEMEGTLVGMFAGQAFERLNHCPALQQTLLNTHVTPCVSLVEWGSPDLEGEIYAACQTDPRGGGWWGIKPRMTPALKTAFIWNLLQENKGCGEAVG